MFRVNVIPYYSKHVSIVVNVEKIFEIFQSAILEPGTMPVYCCAVGYQSLAGKSGKSFFRFPKDKKQRKVWVIAMK